jgi:hypothetical protein
MRERYGSVEASEGPTRLAIGRVRLRSLARVGFSIGWVISLLPALIASALAAWVLHGIWGTLDGWTPWTPWNPSTNVGPFSLPPPPEFRPREALRVEGLYRALAPLGHHPVAGTVLGTLVLTVLGGLLFALILFLAGCVYNLFARATGGIELEVVSRDRRRAVPAGKSGQPGPRRRSSRGGREEEWFLEDETELRW